MTLCGMRSMDSWTDLKLKMEKSLELFDLVEAISHLDALITSASSPSDVSSLLQNHTLRALPTLHYLAGFPYREEDLPNLERVIRIFTHFGYDINKTSPPGVRRLASHGITALLASVKKQNVILVECLLRCGARGDIPDPEGFSPCHWAIKKGNLKCLQTLLEHGGPVLVKPKKVSSLLHDAWDEGHLDIVFYLLRKEDVYVNVVTIFHFLRLTQSSHTTLRRALNMGATPIIDALMKHNPTKCLVLDQLHRFLKSGDTKKALDLMKYFSDEELSTDKIGDQWAPHCIQKSAFVDTDSIEFTKTVILEYVARGWDPNSVNPSPNPISFQGDSRLVTGCSLLHLACIYKGQEIIKLLVENFRVEIDGKLNGKDKLELTPLLILVNTGQFEGATYLIEKGADVNFKGDLGTLGSGSLYNFRVMTKNLTTGNLELNSSVNALELLVRKGNMDGLPLLDQMLARPDVIWHGANEFHLAIEGINPVYVIKVVRHCSKMISKEDLNWVTFCNSRGVELGKLPSLVWLFNMIIERPEWENVEVLAALVKLLAQLGYDLNYRADPDQSSIRLRDALIFYTLTYDPLLRTILQFDNLQLNVTDRRGMNPVKFLLFKWNLSCCRSREVSMCWKSRHLQQPPILETVKLLLAHGLDVSGMVIRPNFKYHSGFNAILKMLCYAGAKISVEYFTSPHFCPWGSVDRNTLAREIGELKEWKDGFDRKTGLSLKHISGLRVRKMLTCIGDLKMLDALPKGLKESVLGTDGYGP